MTTSSKKLIILISALALVILAVVALNTGQSGTVWLWNISREGNWMFPLVGVAALIDSVNPCAFSVFIATMAFLISLGKKRKQLLALGGVYIIGIFLAYLLIGLGILQALHLFSIPHFMGKVGAILLLVLGVWQVSIRLFPRLSFLKQPSILPKKTLGRLIKTSSLPLAFVLGILVGLCEFPCTGGPYLAVLGLLHDQATYLRGFGYLIYYNVIFVSPLVILWLIVGNKTVVDKIKVWRKKKSQNGRLIGGLLLIILGIIILLL